MGAYLQNYGAGEDRRNRIVKFLILGVLAAVVLAVVAYFFFHNRSEEKTVEHFLAQVNAQDYKDAYVTWGCTEATPAGITISGGSLRTGVRRPRQLPLENCLGRRLPILCHSEREGRRRGTSIARRGTWRANRELRAFSRVPGTKMALEAILSADP